MRHAVIHNTSRPQIQPVKSPYCDSFLCRLRGLTFRRHLAPDQGLLLVQPRESRLDSAIHMLGVWLDLAVVWINSDNQVVDTTLAKRWRLAYVPKKPARYILEMPATRLGDFQTGDRVRIEKIDRL